MNVFLATEVTDLVQPDLISIALVTEEGRQFYAERTDYRGQDGGGLVRSQVVPLLGRVPGAACDRNELRERLRNWFADLPEPLAVVCGDAADWDLLDDAIRGDEDLTLLDVADRNVLGRTIVEDAVFLQALAAAYTPEWPRRHALADARALRAGYLAWQASTERARDAPLILFLDFDGVLHPEGVCLDHKGQPMLHGNGQLFMWAPLLIDALSCHPDVRIILSTSWVRRLGLDATLAYLPEALRRRVVGAAWDAIQTDPAFSRGLGLSYWDDATRYQQIRRWVTQKRVAHWIAIDDDARGWGEDDLSRLVRTDGATGLSDLRAMAGLQAALGLQHGSTPGESQ